MWLLLLVACFGAVTPANPDDPAMQALTQGGAQAKDEMDAMKIKADLANLRAAIKLWRATNEDQPPPDLGSLHVSGLSYPDRYSYDASTGEVSDPEHAGW